MSSVPRATTRATRRSRTCYDSFIVNELAFAELCGNCRNYLQIPYKKKKQNEMGKRDYHCTTPGKTSKIIGLPSDTPVTKRPAPLVDSGECDTINLPPPVKKKTKYKEINSELRHSIEAAERAKLVLQLKLDEANTMNKRLSEQLNQECFANCCLKEELEAAKDELAAVNSEKEQLLLSEASANETINFYRNKCRSLVERDRRLDSIDPFEAAASLMTELLLQDVPGDEIVCGFLMALLSRKFKNKTIKFLLSQEMHLRSLFDSIGKKKYVELQEKFKPWVCLRELDFVATVSFRGYEVIRRIEFSNEESDKYMRGLFKSRQELSRLSRKLEEHGAQFLPYSITENSVSFDVYAAVRFILEKFGLWSYVENEDLVTVAATVDGGDLAWKLTQVSGGIKICDPKAINPLTGEKLFGECGTKCVQSRYVCFPLKVHIAKDNGNYDKHLSVFFHDLESLEDDYIYGLQFSQGADMSSLQKTLKRGTYILIF